eukprot:scaffold5060_cov123-Skeletonema_dohrnii-CCMP3373.AAC.1
MHSQIHKERQHQPMVSEDVMGMFCESAERSCASCVFFPFHKNFLLGFGANITSAIIIGSPRIDLIG